MMLSWILLICFATTAHAQNWTVTGSLTYARQYHTATLLSNGNVLVAGGYDNYPFITTSAELYNASTGVWAVTGSLTYARYGHTATLLLNGNVLVVGGFANTFLNSAEFYNATTGLWTVAGNLTYARRGHTATLLTNGNVLVAGGYVIRGTAEVYNATTGVWTVTGSLTCARRGHTATLLPNGNVLVAGGHFFIDKYLNSAELYKPSTGVWTVTSNLTYARGDHTATLLPNGNVLVAGGYDNDTYLNSAEVYNAAIGVWTMTSNLTNARVDHTATLLPNGNVLVAGGYDNDTYLNSAEVYNAAIGVWTMTGNLTKARFCHTATLLSNGNVLVAGGDDRNTTELYTATDVWPFPDFLIYVLYPAPLLVLPLLWLLRSGYWNKKVIQKENKSLDNSSHSPPMLAVSDVKSSVDSRLQSSEIMSNQDSVDNLTRSATSSSSGLSKSELTSSQFSFSTRPRTSTDSSSILAKSDDILIPFTSLKLGVVLGQGHFGQVFQATYRGGSAAVKKLKGVDKLEIMEEAKMMKSIPNHSNVLQYFGVSEHEGEIMIVTEKCDKGNLAQYLRNSNNNLTLVQCRQLCGQIASGMWHISTYGIVHRDLRAENIFLSSGEEIKAKVADFGMARSLQSRDNTRNPAYYRVKEGKEIPIAWTAPEVLTDQQKYVAESDVWSFGVLMWEIYSQGARPFDDLDIQVVIAIIRSRNRSTPLLARPDNCPDDIFNIMNSCWAFNPQDRPTFEQLYNQISAFF